MNQKQIEFIGFHIDKVEFERNINFQFTDDAIKLETKINHDIKKISDEGAIITLKYEILQDKDKSSPFSLCVIISGAFKMKDWEREENINIMKYDTAAILFPYLRSAVTNITAMANIPPYVMPTINPHTFFAESAINE